MREGSEDPSTVRSWTMGTWPLGRGWCAEKDSSSPRLLQICCFLGVGDAAGYFPDGDPTPRRSHEASDLLIDGEVGAVSPDGDARSQHGEDEVATRNLDCYHRAN